MGKNKVVFVIAAVILLIGLVTWQVTSRKGDDLTMPSTSGSPTSIPTQKQVSVEEAKISFFMPATYNFNKEQQMNLTTKKPYAVNFTIQNYENNPNSVPNAYQLYGNYQWDTNKMNVENFQKADFYLEPSSRELFTVAGHPAVKGVTREERKRYTIYIYNDGFLLMLAANGIDDEHKKITDEIVKSITFTQ